MGSAGGSFGQTFANTLIQGSQLIEQVKGRREELDLKKKLAAAQLQEHDAKTQLVTRKLQGMTELSSLSQPREWEDSEFSAGGVAPAPPIPEHTRLRLAMLMDPDAAAKELLASGRRQDPAALIEKFLGGGEQAAPQTAPARAEAPALEAPAPGQPPATTLGPQRKLDRTASLKIGADGGVGVELKVGERNVQFKIDHEAEPLLDGRVQNYRVITNPEDPRQQQRVPVGAPQLPKSMETYAATATSWGLQPGSELHATAVADQAAVATMFQPGRAQEIAFADLAEKYRTLGTARPVGAAPPAAPATSPRERARAEEVSQASRVAGATAEAKDVATRNAPIGDDAVRFVNRRTLQHPQADAKRRDVEGNPDFVQISPDVAKKLPQYQTTKAALERLEAIVLQSPDYFPESTGNAAQDIGRVAIATAKFKATARTDPRAGEIQSLRISMPGTIKMFGDSGNISEAERAMAESALGLEPSTREQALQRIDSIRGLVNNTVAPMGLPPIQRKPGPKPTAKTPEATRGPRFRYDDKTGNLVPVKP